MLTNVDIWKPTTWNDKREKRVIVCGRQRLSWKRIITVVEQIYVQGETLVILVAAAGPDYKTPTEHDLTNASVAALVVAKQRRFSAYRNNMRVYLSYGPSTIMGVDVDLGETERRIEAEFPARRRGEQLPFPVPSVMLGLLEKFRRL